MLGVRVLLIVAAGLLLIGVDFLFYTRFGLTSLDITIIGLTCIWITLCLLIILGALIEKRSSLKVYRYLDSLFIYTLAFISPVAIFIYVGFVQPSEFQTQYILVII